MCHVQLRLINHTRHYLDHQSRNRTKSGHRQRVDTCDMISRRDLAGGNSSRLFTPSPGCPTAAVLYSFVRFCYIHVINAASVRIAVCVCVTNSRSAKQHADLCAAARSTYLFLRCLGWIGLIALGTIAFDCVTWQLSCCNYFIIERVQLWRLRWGCFQHRSAWCRPAFVSFFVNLFACMPVLIGHSALAVLCDTHLQIHSCDKSKCNISVTTPYGPVCLLRGVFGCNEASLQRTTQRQTNDIKHTCQKHTRIGAC
jgi:hypothetical protein